MISVQQRIQAGIQPFSSPTTIPSPVKGWNARDELDAMDPLDAVTLDNWFPDVSGVTVRAGYKQLASGMGNAPVETLAEWRVGGTGQFLAACNGGIFNVSALGIVSSPIKSGFTSNRWQSVNFSGHLFLTNGADNAQVYDGTTMSDAGFTGVALNTLIGCYLYQQRLFFWQVNSSGFWFATTINGISGPLSFFDLATFCPRGANLIAVTTVTHDGGNGVLDFIAFIMSSGDMLLFFGNDPSLLSNWQMIGRYRVSPPVNIRAICQYGGDSFVTTYDDYMPIQQQLVALKVGTLAPRSKVSGAIQAAIIANGSAFGWQSLYYPRGRRLIFNVPNVDGTFDQHVCNTGLPGQPWCRFKGMNAHTWGLFGDSLYFGGDGGIVYGADIGFSDDGEPVQAVAQQAWNKANSSQRKRMAVVRPIVQSNQGSYNFAIGFDYGPLNIPEPVSIDGPVITDDSGNPITNDSNVAITAGVAGINNAWHAAGGSGTAFAFGLNVLSSGQTSWLRTDFRMEQGNAL